MVLDKFYNYLDTTIKSELSAKEELEELSDYEQMVQDKQKKTKYEQEF